MVRRCSSCHNFVTEHHGVPSGPECTLQHHPEPCDWEDDRRPNVVCTHYDQDTHEVNGEGDVIVHEQAEPTDPGAALQLLKSCLAQLEREKEDQARRANQLMIANKNLLTSQN